MAEENLSMKRIRVGDGVVAVLGLDEVIQALAFTHGDASDSEAASALLEYLSQKNYIPDRARSEYGKAFVREFRRFLGQPFEEPGPKTMEVKILGAGCVRCDQLEQAVLRVLEGLGMAACVEHVKEIREIARYGVAGTPALVINDKVVSVGRTPSEEQMKKWFLETSGGAIS